MSLLRPSAEGRSNLLGCGEIAASPVAPRDDIMTQSESEESPFFPTRDSSVAKLPQNDILQVIFSQKAYLIAGLIIPQLTI